MTDAIFDEEHLKGMLADINLRCQQTGMPVHTALTMVSLEEGLSRFERIYLQLMYELHNSEVH